MPFCCVPNCNRSNDKDVATYPFPKQGEFRVQWIEALGLSERNVRIGDRICADHFESGDFLETRRGLKSWRLKSGVIPVKVKVDDLAFSDSPSSQTPKSSPKRSPRKKLLKTICPDPDGDSISISPPAKIPKKRHSKAKSNPKSTARDQKESQESIAISSSTTIPPGLTVTTRYCEPADSDKPTSSAFVATESTKSMYIAFGSPDDHVKDFSSCSNKDCIDAANTCRALQRDLIAHERQASSLHRSIAESRDEMILVQEAITRHDLMDSRDTATIVQESQPGQPAIKAPCFFCAAGNDPVRHLYDQSLVREEVLREKVSVLEEEQELMNRLINEAPKMFPILFRKDELESFGHSASPGTIVKTEPSADD